MVEQTHVSPLNLKGSPERQRIAAHLLYSRALEHSGGYTTNRDATRYVNSMLGLRHFFDYVRSLPSGKVVLDIGAGLSIGTHQLANQKIGKDLKFIATGLVRDPVVQNYIGNSNYRITGAETLRGIDNSSVGGVIALHSITYSESPVQSIDRINDVLVPGGGLKATFRNDGFQDEDFAIKSRYKKHDEFSQRLGELGFDVSWIERESFTLLLAIKPGSSLPASARQLLENDRKEFYSFFAKLKRGKERFNLGNLLGRWQYRAISIPKPKH